ncbi:MAG: heavy metal translocating P-type ATPase [Gemmatimonadaceae bacterium]|nr:heavy metal translocating P-type ATPase [Gemmatimonadaceae bacterium]
MTPTGAVDTPAPPGAAVTCAHCALPVPPALMHAGDVAQFCCAGCRTAHEIIHAAGLGRYYDFDERRHEAVPASAADHAAFDHPTFHELYVQRGTGGTATVQLHLEGVHCASCVWLVERMPLVLDGVLRAELDVTRALATITWEPARTPLSAIAANLERLGYRPHPFRGLRAEAMRRAEDRAMLVNIGVSGALATNVMLLAIALYSGFTSRAGALEPAFEVGFRWLSLLLTAVSVFWPGRVFFRTAWAALRQRTVHVDVPIALALGAGFVRGAMNTVSNSGPIYLDGVALLIFLLLVGRFFQQRAQRAAVDSAELLHSLAPASAHLVDGETERDVPAEALLPGMIVAVRANETIPADGTIASGVSVVDLSLLTGESRPEPVAPGDLVYAGTVNLGAPLRVQVERAGEATRVGALLREVAAGAARRAPMVQYANRVGGWFVWLVLALATITYAIWFQLDRPHALDAAIAFLVVTCPCALALGTPLAITVAIGRAARRGILVKGGDALERLATPGTLVLDKTGTLTAGRMTVAAWQGDDEARALALALERETSHPIAAAFTAAWPGLVAPRAEQVEHVLGGGVRGRVDGHDVIVGSPRFVIAQATVPDWATAPLADTSLTPVFVAVDGVIVARAGIGDPLRPEAPAAVAALQARGWTVQVLSGDDPSVVRRIGAQLQLPEHDVQGGVTPERKLAAIERLAATGTVVMVGDGVNDAAAIARASVGIGVKGGAEACLAAADIFLATPGLAPLVTLMDGSARTLGVIRRCLWVSLFYNAIGAVLAMTGVINPMIAAILMPISSTSVVLAAWKSRTFDAPEVGAP